MIMCSNLLYLWIDQPKKVLRAVKELKRILKPGGEIRIFPVNFGSYHLNNEKLFEYINNNFFC